MAKSFKQNLIDIVGKELEKQGYVLVAELGYLVYHYRTENYIHIVQFCKGKYEPFIEVVFTTVFPNEDKEHSNIHYPSFNKFSEGNINKITVDDCVHKHFIKGNYGSKFYYEYVYLALGQGVVGVSDKAKKPFGIRLKKHTEKTYVDVCNLIKKRLFETLSLAKCKCE